MSFAVVTSLEKVPHMLEPTDDPSAKAFVLIGVLAGVVYPNHWPGGEREQASRKREVPG